MTAPRRLSFVQKYGRSIWHIVAPLDTTRTVCGADVVNGDVSALDPQGKVCGSCERMRGSAEATAARRSQSALRRT